MCCRLLAYHILVGGCSEGLGKRGAQWMEVISWEPRAFDYHNFLVITAAAAHSAFPSTPITTAAAAMVHSVLHLLMHAHCPVFVTILVTMNSKQPF